MTHDSSTLGGNSGSAIVDVQTGRIVGLHFAGAYLKANYAAPTHELARDPRVVGAGVNFAGSVPATGDFDAAWARTDGDEASAGRTCSPATPVFALGTTTATWILPIQISISIVQPTLCPTGSTGAARTPAVAPTVPEAEGMKVPVIYPDLEHRGGYRPDFLRPSREDVPLPELTVDGKKIAARIDDGSYVLKYHHFSVVMHKKRRLALFTAANVDWRDESRAVDGRKPSRRALTSLGRNDVERWVTDPRIPDAHQLPDVFFTKDRGSFDKGHLVRRDDVCWGDSFEDMQKANGDTYHTTNCSPQVARFNQSALDEDNWGALENLVQQQTRAEKVCVFSGPVMDDDDPVFLGRDLRGEVAVQVPRKYWKIVVTSDNGAPAAYGFILQQDLSMIDVEMTVPAKWRRHMARIVEIEAALGGLVRLTRLKALDRFGSQEGLRIAETVGSG